MNGRSIRGWLTGGDPRRLQNVDEVVALVLAWPERVDELIGCVLEGDDPTVRMRAADALEKVARARPSLLRPHVPLVLTRMSTISQSSVQWHVAQILGQVELTVEQRRNAAAILRGYLHTSSDWIVLNCSLDAFARLARHDPSLVPSLRGFLDRFANSRYRSLASRARKLIAEFGA